ncbi:MAG: YmfQ family protein [Janthinobacterium lividum]
MNPFALLGSSSYLGALQKLLPRGVAFPRNPTSVQTAFVAANGDLFGDLQAACSVLSEVESDPAQTMQLLSEWEAEYGLPDPCAGESPLVSERRAQLLARIAATGGQSPAYYIAFALTLGYAITITEFEPLCFGDTFGSLMYGQSWAQAWQVNAPTFTVDYADFGSSVFGDPYAAWGSNVLQCELNRIKPAHTPLIFNYS